MTAFLFCVAMQLLLLVLLVAGVWKYTTSILKGEAELASYVLPTLELAHQFTSATSGLQSQGLLLQSAETEGDLKLRKLLLEGSIRETKALIQLRPELNSIDSRRLADSIDKVHETVIGLSDVRARQLNALEQQERDSAIQFQRINRLNQLVQSRILSLSQRLLERRPIPSSLSDQNDDYSTTLEFYNQALESVEITSQDIQRYLLLNQELISLKSLLERLPGLRAEVDVTTAEQKRDLLIESMLNRSRTITDQGIDQFLINPLKVLSDRLTNVDNLFDGRRFWLRQDQRQKKLSSRLAQLTIEVPSLTEKIRFRSAAALLDVSSATRARLERYRVFLFSVLLFYLVVLGTISYWLLYRRTVLPLGEVVGQLDRAGTDIFSPSEHPYFIKEIDELSHGVHELDRVQKRAKCKDIQLKNSNNELRKSNEELEQFVHVASHDLQEPLRKLQQFSSLLEDDYAEVLDEDGKFYLRTIASSAHRMSTMIKDTLAYARSAKNREVDTEIDLNKIIDTVLNDMDIAIAEAGASIEVAKLPWVVANSTCMSQLFGNLLLNAVKYRRPDVACQIRIDLDRESDDSAIIIRVQDNGVGIDNQYLRKVFVPFERLNTTKTAGTGLGLAICMKVCDAHGWAINVTSRVGEGSCFHIKVPYKDVQKESARE